MQADSLGRFGRRVRLGGKLVEGGEKPLVEEAAAGAVHEGVVKGKGEVPEERKGG